MKMWRSFTILLFIFALAQVANATAAPWLIDAAKLTQPQGETLLSNATPLSESALDMDDQPDNLFNLPRLNRVSPSLFSAAIQVNRPYVLVIEFFEVKLSAALFKNLSNPPTQLQWFEQRSAQSSSARISGWKDGNSLYCSRITYHS